MAKKSVPTEPVDGVLLVDDPSVTSLDDQLTGMADHPDPPGMPVVPVVDSQFDSRITAGEYRANGVEIDPNVADDEIPHAVMADRHVAPGTPVEPVREHVVVSETNNESGLSAADRIAALNESTRSEPEPVQDPETSIEPEPTSTEESEAN